DSSGVAFITNATIAENQSLDAASGGGLQAQSNVVVNNSIIALNHADTNELDVAGSLDAQGRSNFIGVAGTIGITNGVNGNQIGDSNTPWDPKLTTFGDHGGPTATYALLPTSPAVDAGSNNAADGLNEDQRGL